MRTEADALGFGEVVHEGEVGDDVAAALGDFGEAEELVVFLELGMRWEMLQPILGAL